MGDPDEKKIYLTFDNGYEEGYTGMILDVLKEKQVPATFFLTGHYVDDEPELTKRMVNEGHIIEIIRINTWITQKQVTTK